MSSRSDEYRSRFALLVTEVEGALAQTVRDMLPKVCAKHKIDERDARIAFALGMLSFAGPAYGAMYGWDRETEERLTQELEDAIDTFVDNFDAGR